MYSIKTMEVLFFVPDSLWAESDCQPTQGNVYKYNEFMCVKGTRDALGSDSLAYSESVMMVVSP